MRWFGVPNVEKLRARKDIPGLIKALACAEDEKVVAAAAAALGEIHPASAIQPLLSSLEQDLQASTKEAIAASLARCSSYHRDLEGMLGLVHLLRNPELFESATFHHR